MQARFVSKLETLVDLDQRDLDLLQTLRCETIVVGGHRDILRRGDEPSFAYVVVDGWAARYNVRRDGTRRITGFLMPGDFCGIHAVCGAPMDHSLTALTPCAVAKIEATEISRLSGASPNIAQALWRAKLAEEASLRTWLLNSENARRALGHLICELHERAGRAGLTERGSIELPLTQQDLGDALGITAVHTNRILQQLRADGLVEFSNARLRIPDVDALRREASFSAVNLQLPCFQPTGLPAASAASGAG